MSNLRYKHQPNLDNTVADQILLNSGVKLNGKEEYEKAVKIVESIPTQVLDNPVLVPTILKLNETEKQVKRPYSDAALMWLKYAPEEALKKYKLSDIPEDIAVGLIQGEFIPTVGLIVKNNLSEDKLKNVTEAAQGNYQAVKDMLLLLNSYPEMEWTAEKYQEYDKLSSFLGGLGKTVGLVGNGEITGDTAITAPLEAVEGNTQPMEKALASLIVKNEDGKRVIEAISGYTGNTYWKAYGQVMNTLYNEPVVEGKKVINGIASGKIQVNNALVKAAADGRYFPDKIARKMIMDYTTKKIEKHSK